MSIRFEIPQDIEQQLRSEGLDLNREAKEVYLLEQYRQERISHAQLREALGVSFHEAERLIKERGAGQDISLEEFEAGREFLRKARTKGANRHGADGDLTPGGPGDEMRSQALMSQPLDKTVGGVHPVPWKTASKTAEQD